MTGDLPRLTRPHWSLVVTEPLSSVWLSAIGAGYPAVFMCRIKNSNAKLPTGKQLHICIMLLR